MSMTVRELRKWLEHFEGDELLAIDVDAMTLIALGSPYDYCEVGADDEVDR
jgi:hypothetical protein